MSELRCFVLAICFFIFLDSVLADLIEREYPTDYLPDAREALIRND